MRAEDIKKLLKSERFEPIGLGLTDGRTVIIRHPDQVVVAERHVLIGLAQLETSPPLSTPATEDAIARDWLIVNLLHIATIGPATDGQRKSRRRRRG